MGQLITFDFVCQVKCNLDDSDVEQSSRKVVAEIWLAQSKYCFPIADWSNADDFSLFETSFKCRFCTFCEW